MEEGKLYGFLAYLLGIIGFVIVIATKKDNKFAMFHAKQSLVLFIGWIAAGILWVIPIPFVNWGLSGLLYLLLMVLWIMGMVYALTGQEKKLPVVGDLAEKFKI
jgi:uncharacterized membrane protein